MVHSEACRVASMLRSAASSAWSISRLALSYSACDLRVWIRSVAMRLEVATVLALMEPRIGPCADMVGRDSDAELEGREPLPLALVGGVDDSGEAMPDDHAARRHS